MSAAYSCVSYHYWRAYWITLRPYLMFLSGVSGLVGLAQAPGLVPGGIFWTMFVIFFLSYGLGQALTDVFQTDTDAISSPYRPLTQGLITKKQVFLTSLLGLLLCGLVFFIKNPLTLAFSLLGVVGLATYTLFKRYWWGGPLWNAWIVALLPLIGFMCGENHGLVISSVLFASMLSVFFSYAIFVLLGYFKDISADRITGYRTFPVVFGWKPAIILSFCFLFGAIVSSAYVISHVSVNRISMVFWLSSIGCLVWSHGKMWQTKDESKAYLAIGWVVRGYVMMHLGEVIAFTPELTWFAFGYYGIFEWVLAYRPERTQI